MNRISALDAALLFTAILTATGCGDGQQSQAASTTSEVPGLLDVPSGQANGQPSTTMIRSAQMHMASAKGEMSTYMMLIDSKGSDGMQRKAAKLNKQFQADIQTARTLLLKMANAKGKTLTRLVKQYNSNWKHLQHTLGRAEALQMQALGAG